MTTEERARDKSAWTASGEVAAHIFRRWQRRNSPTRWAATEEPSMKLAGFALALWAALVATPSLAAQPAPRVTTTLSATELTALEAVRKAVWVDWFSGDTAALRRALGPELVAMSAGAPYWQSLGETIAASAKFRAGGGKLVSVGFDSTMTHRFGETAVMFSRYSVVTESTEGRATLKGRATEVFVRTNGRWVHTSWHLDSES
jgi:hypothetical protein